jgi:hypothetical protein
MPSNPPRPPEITIVEPYEAAGQPVSIPLPGPRPLDWEHVVDAAAARLEESWVRPDATGYMMASGLADEFAATLCAYGMAAEEADHMHVRMDKALAHHRHISGVSLLTPAGISKTAVVAAK